jgi:hypothetical protein
MPPYIHGEPRHLSNSQIELLLECTWKHKLKYIDDHVEPTNEHLLIGSSIHKGVETYRIAQLEGRLSDWTETQRNQACLDAMNNEFDQLLYDAEHGRPLQDGEEAKPVAGVRWSRGMRVDIARNFAKQLLSVYFYRTAESDISGTPKVPLAMLDEPVSIEEEFYVPIPGTNNWFAKGRFDMRTADGLVDLKTARQRYSQKEMDKKTQPSFYMLAWLGKSTTWLPQFRYHLLVKPNKAVWDASSGTMPPASLKAYRACVQSTSRTPQEITWFLRYLRQQIKVIETGSQFTRQNAEWCDYCGVASICKPWLGGRGGQGAEDVLQSLREEFTSHESAGQHPAG